MRSLFRLLLLLGCVGLLTPGPPAQSCGPITNIFAAVYGKGCPGAGSSPPTLKAALVAGSPCRLQVTIDNVTWFPNVYFNGWILLVGAAPTAIPVVRPGCTLRVLPLVALAYDRTTRIASLPLPRDPALLGAKVRFQGAARYVGFYFGPDLTAGLEVTFR